MVKKVIIILLCFLLLFVSISFNSFSRSSVSIVYATDGRLYNQMESKWRSPAFEPVIVNGVTHYPSKEGVGGNTLYDGGCSIFSFCNAVYALNGSIADPVEVGWWGCNNKGFWPGYQGANPWQLYSNIEGGWGTKLGFTVLASYRNGTASDSLLKNSLKNGGVAVAHISGHFIALAGYNESAGTFLVIDSACMYGLPAYGWVAESKLKSGGSTVTAYMCLSNTLSPTIWCTNLTPANLGDSFDALILNKAAWIPIRTLSSTNVVTHPEEWVTDELWRFTRQLDGSYQILNWKNGLCLDANNFGTTDGTNIGSVASNNSTAQKWFIYSVNGGYVLRPSYGELAMDSWGDSTSNGNNVHLWTYQGHDGQLMSIYKDEAAPLGKPAPSAPTVTAVSDTSLSVTWSSTIYTDKYIVYRSTDNSTWIKLVEVTTPGYTDTGLKANTKYYYKYESVNRFYTVSSASASGTTKPVPAYTVKYNSNNGTGSMDDQTLIYDQAVNLTANAFSRTGYTFAGWNTKADGTGTSYADKASVKNLAAGGTITLYAQWTANKYTVKFNGNGADELSTASKEVTYNSTYGELPNSIRAGYNFIGWYTQPEGGVVITPDTKVAITDTQTLYAQWSQVKFLITFNANGGTSEMRQKLVSSDNKYGVLPSAEKIGYEFGGWYLDEAFTKQITEDTIVKITKNQEVYAKWVQKKYTVTFEVNGGTVDMKTKKVVAGKVYGVLPEAEKNGFEFAGWFTESGKEITSDSIVELTADTVLYAKWRLRGDVDADGDVDVADVVLLQRWLLAGSTTMLNDWQAGDLCEDGRIDVFDLCLMKRMLIEG